MAGAGNYPAPTESPSALAGPTLLMSELAIDYQHLLTEAEFRDPVEAIRKLSEELPFEWADAYRKMSPHRANIWRIKPDGFEYLFDCSSELVLQGDLSSDDAVEDRIVAVHGLSQAIHHRRQDSLMRKQTSRASRIHQNP